MAHIPILETLDDLGIKPSIISGTSMGAIIGALYASGMSGKEIREHISRHLILKDDTWQNIIAKKGHLLKWVSALSQNSLAVDLSTPRDSLSTSLAKLKGELSKI